MHIYILLTYALTLKHNYVHQHAHTYTQAVMHKRPAVFDWLLEYGGKDSLLALNDQGLTPVTLAVRLGSEPMFQHIRHSTTDTNWKIGKSKLVVTSLEQIDTYRIKGTKRDSGILSPQARLWRLSSWGSNRVKDVGGMVKSGGQFLADGAAIALNDAETAFGPRHTQSAMNPLSQVSKLSDHMLSLQRALALNNQKLLKENLLLHPQFASCISELGISEVNSISFKHNDVRRLSSTVDELHSSEKWRCALEVVVRHEIDEFFDVDVFDFLIEEKWNKFACRMHFQRTIIFLGFVLIAMINAVSVFRVFNSHKWCNRAKMLTLENSTGSPGAIATQNRIWIR